MAGGYAPVAQQEPDEGPVGAAESRGSSRRAEAEPRAWRLGLGAAVLVAVLLGIIHVNRLRNPLRTGSPLRMVKLEPSQLFAKSDPGLEECLAPSRLPFNWGSWTMEEEKETMLVKTLTVTRAQETCATLPGCRGFTFHEGADPNEAVEIMFKSSWKDLAGSAGTPKDPLAGWVQFPRVIFVYMLVAVAVAGIVLSLFRLTDSSLYDYTPLYLAIRAVIFVVCGTLVMALVALLIFHHPPTGPTPPKDESDRLCRMAPEEYQALDMCTKGHLATWKDYAQIADRLHGKITKCHLDPDTGLETCNDDFKCQGGANKNLQIVNVHHSAIYDCTACDNDSELLRIECCSVCMQQTCPKAKAGEFMIGGEVMDKVVCVGCDKNALDRISRKAHNFCKLSGSSFDCTYNATCKMGVPEQRVHNQAYSCSSRPCDGCGDPTAHAQCCVDCLESTCATHGANHVSSKEVCSGCSAKALADFKKALQPHVLHT
mmetsp:Transcript_97364/g.208908  ORF Transcript_97364/g.208908 Transcript_97364/m.208908 type:complete len:485 (-) Transcript_97364:100-1554(-)